MAHLALAFFFPSPQMQSLESSCDTMAVVAATLANGGFCPLTPEAGSILDGTAVQHCLSLMHSCGMYEYSGQFSFKVKNSDHPQQWNAERKYVYPQKRYPLTPYILKRTYSFEKKVYLYRHIDKLLRMYNKLKQNHTSPANQ